MFDVVVVVVDSGVLEEVTSVVFCEIMVEEVVVVDSDAQEDTSVVAVINMKCSTTPILLYHKTYFWWLM